jgi:hypothetical protein
VDVEHAGLDSPIRIIVRDKLLAAKVVRVPFS